MKKDNGVTMISLVATIAILLLLSTVSYNVGTEAFDMIKVQGFISKLKVIQGKVDNISAETDDVSSYGFTPLTMLQASNPETYNFFVDIILSPTKYNIDTSNSWNSSEDIKVNNYYYFKDDDLKLLGLKNQEIEVIINFKTRNIIAKKGVKKDDKMYYRQYDLSAGESLVNN